MSPETILKHPEDNQELINHNPDSQNNDTNFILHDSAALAELEQSADTNAFAMFLIKTIRKIEPELYQSAHESIVRTGQELHILPDDTSSANEIMRNAFEWLDPHNQVLRESPLRDNIAINNLTDIEQTFQQANLHYLVRILNGEIDAKKAHDHAISYFSGDPDEDHPSDETLPPIHEPLSLDPGQASDEVPAHSTGFETSNAHPMSYQLGTDSHASIVPGLTGPAHQNTKSILGGAATTHSTPRFQRAKPLPVTTKPVDSSR